MKTRKKILIGLAALLAIVIIACAIFVMDYYHASDEAVEAIADPPQGIKVTEIQEGVWAFQPEDPETGIIFYPGGKVEAESYSPLMEALAEEGILAILVSMPGNLAFMDADAAEGIPEQFPEVIWWYMAGHSLGGSMAASYVIDHVEEYEGLILLASYTTTDLTHTPLFMLSVYGDRDGVLNMESYEENKANVSEHFQEVVIEGGCHSYFGDYGLQEGDGNPEITRQQQLDMTVEAIVKFIDL